MKSKLPDQIVHGYHERYHQDLDLWAKEVLGVFLWSKQREILHSIGHNRRTVVPSGHAVGKTFTAAVATLAFLFSNPYSKVITTAPTWQQVSLQLWSKINSLVRQHLPGLDADPLQTQLRVGGEWYATGLSPKYAVNFQGFHAPSVLIILDEAPGVRYDIYDGAESLMAGGNAHMLLIGNPTENSGFFYDACEGQKSASWNVIPISCYDSPNFTDEKNEVPPGILQELVSHAWVEEMIDEWGEDSPLFRAKVLGKFPDSTSNSVVPLSWYEVAEQRWEELKELPDMGGVGADIHLGVDVAWEGDDKSVLNLRRGKRCETIDEYSGMDPVVLANTVGRHIIEHGVLVVAVDVVGIGAGTYSRLIEKKREGNFHNVHFVPFKASERANAPDKFPNRRSEMWWKLREALHPERGWLALDPKDRKLKAEVTQATYHIDSESRIKVESKQEMKTRLRRSPDRADALMCTLACARWSNMKPAMESYLAKGWHGAAVDTLAGAIDEMP